LEQYEDTLNNLTLTNKIGEADFMKGAEKDQFMMKYMLDLEGRESLFDIDTFRKPFSHSMKITKNGEMTEKNIDLIETFNYLAGITVKTIKKWENGVFSLVGTMKEDNKTKEVLVVWRDMENISQEDFTAFYDKELKGSYDKVFINGSTYNITEAEMIEEVFYHKMLG
jgi:adenine-specific DNA-methyltransferase